MGDVIFGIVGAGMDAGESRRNEVATFVKPAATIDRVTSLITTIYFAGDPNIKATMSTSPEIGAACRTVTKTIYIVV